MPSGITHMIISRKAQDYAADLHDNAMTILNQYRGPYMVGAVGPDLPYMTLADKNIFINRKEIADDLHYKKTAQLPLLGLKLAKNLFEKGNIPGAGRHL